MKRRIRKLLSVLLALMTVISLLPVSALADGGLTITVTNQGELTTVLKEDITVTGDDVQTMGKIIVPEGFRLTVADGAYLEAGIDNYGSIEVESGGSLATAMGGNITNNGALTVKKGGVLRSQKGGSVVNGGTMVLDGEFYCGVLHKTEEDPDTIYFRNRGEVAGSGSVIPYQMTPAIPVDMKAAAEALRGMLPDTITVAADPATTACDAVVSAPAGTVVEASGGEQSIGTVSVSDAKNAEHLYLGVRYTMLASGENSIGITVIGRNQVTDTDHVFDHPGTGEAEGDTYPIIYSSGDSAQTAAKRPMDMFVRIDAAQLASAPDGIYTALLVYDIRSDTAAVPKNMTQTLTLEKRGAGAYAVAVEPSRLTLTAEEGYGEGDVYRDIEVTSTGADKIDFVMAGAWDISAYEIFSVTSSGMSVRVCARAGLKAGVYTAAVMIHDTENRFEPVRVPVTFTVTAKSAGGGGGGGSVVGGETAAQYTLTYKTNGGNAIAPTEHDGGTIVTLTAAPAREGHTFTGWYSDAKLTNRITSVVMDGDKTVYAGWKENEASAPSDAFTDVPAGAWYREAVDYVAERGLMNGTSADRFSPNVTTTRAMIVTTLYRLEGEPAASGETVFDDVAAGSWYAKAVAWAAANGIAMGYGDGRFGPDDRITREQFAAIMYRYASFRGYDTSVGQDTNILSYDDAFAVSRWAMEAMQWACGAGLISGRTATTLAPGGEATRAEAAAILMRFVENVK